MSIKESTGTCSLKEAKKSKVRQLSPPHSEDVRMVTEGPGGRTVLRLLQEIRAISNPTRAHQALRLAASNLVGTGRSLIVERVCNLSEGQAAGLIDQLIKDPRLHLTSFLSLNDAGALFQRVRFFQGRVGFQGQSALSERIRQARESIAASSPVSDAARPLTLAGMFQYFRDCELTLSSRLERELTGGIRFLERRLGEDAARVSRRSIQLASEEFFSGAPAWKQQLLVHCYQHRQTFQGNFGFLLRAARLLRQISHGEAVRRGFKRTDLTANEHNREEISWKKFQGLCQDYGIRRQILAGPYLSTFFGDIDFRRLPFWSEPVFLEKVDLLLMERYFKRPGTFGERVFLAVAQKGLTLPEAAREVTCDVRDLREIVQNKSFGTPLLLRKMEEKLNISLDEVLRLIQWTFFEDDYEFLCMHEPIYIAPQKKGQADEMQKIRHYKNKPGTRGELVFFSRKRKFLSLVQLARLFRPVGDLSYARDRFSLIEWGKEEPTREEADFLIRTLDLPSGLWG